jgi:DNA-binding CsgD family transcriptional regulator
MNQLKLRFPTPAETQILGLLVSGKNLPGNYHTQKNQIHSLCKKHNVHGKVALVSAITNARWSDDSRLTPRMNQVARGIIEGKVYAEIARNMGVKPATVKNYSRAVFDILQVRSKLELVVRAGEFGK